MAPHPIILHLSVARHQPLPVQLVVPLEKQTQEKDTEEVNRMSVVAEGLVGGGGGGLEVGGGSPSALRG